MVNDINGIRPTINTGTANGSSVDGRADRQQPQAPAEEASADRIELSAEAQLLSRLEAQVNATPEVDQARVDAVREAIQSGSFEIDNSSLADSIQVLDRLL